MEGNAKPDSRLTSLLPSNIRGGLMDPKVFTSGTNRNDAMPPPASSSYHQDKGGSLLGLDRLAQQIRSKNIEESSSTSYKVSDRHYRRIEEETPSHPGGVNKDVFQRQKMDAIHKFRRKDVVSHSRNDAAPPSNHTQYWNQPQQANGDNNRIRSIIPRSDQTPSSSHVHDKTSSTNSTTNSYYTHRRTHHTDSWETETPMHNQQRNDEDEWKQKRSRISRDMDSYSHSRHPNSKDSLRSSSSFSSSVRHFPTSIHTHSTPMSSLRPISDNAEEASMTPRTNRTKDDTKPSTYDDDDDDDDFDRKFYLADDDEYVYDETDGIQGGGGGGNQRNMGRFLYESNKTKQREEEMERRRLNSLDGRGGGGNTSYLRDAKKNALRDDQLAWEENRLFSSGAAIRGDIDVDIIGQEEETRVTLLVHQVKPPFLMGSGISFSSQRQAVATVKDSTSDFARMAREGSEMLRYVREKKDKKTMKQKFWEIGGSRMGDVMRVKEMSDESGVVSSSGDGDDTGDRDEGVNDGGEIDYKKSMGFASHVTKKDKDAGPVSEFARTKSIREQREYLPVFTVRDDLLNVIREHSVVIVVGETGSGKTTQLTQYLYEEGYCEYGIVGCTQPRRVGMSTRAYLFIILAVLDSIILIDFFSVVTAAMSVAKRVSEEIAAAVTEKGIPLTEKDQLGGTVGYSIRFEDQTSEHTVIKYMTDGVLLRESIRDPELNKYSAIIMDEAHERSLNTDVLFGVLRKVIMRRSDLKLIVTSATLSADTFSRFFGNQPIFRIPGRTFPVDVLYAKSVQEDYVMSAVKQTIQIHCTASSGDILIFMTGQEDIEGTCTVLAEKLEQLGSDCPPLLILPMYSQLPADLQAKIFDAAPKGVRKCVVSTNVAETSLTVDGIKYGKPVKHDFSYT